MSNSITTAELAIYAVLIIPVIFVLIKHGFKAATGWGFLAAFCMLRIVGGALALANVKSASIISSVGLSPLLLSSAGILHEVRMYRDTSINKKIEWIIMLKYHMAVMAGVAILAVGSSKLQSGDTNPSTDLTLVKVGIAILTVCWVALVFFAALTLNSRARSNTEAHAESTKLLYGVLAALLFIGVRVIYTLAALVSNNPKINPNTGSLAVRVILSLLMELIAVLILIGAGVITRNIKRYPKSYGSPEMTSN